MKKFWWKLKLAWKVLTHSKFFLFEGGETYTDVTWLNLTSNVKTWAIGELTDGSGYQVGIALRCNKYNTKEEPYMLCLQNYDKEDDAKAVAYILNGGLENFTNSLYKQIKTTIKEELTSEIIKEITPNIEVYTKEQLINEG